MMTGFQAEENLTGRAPKKMCEKFWTLSSEQSLLATMAVIPTKGLRIKDRLLALQRASCLADKNTKKGRPRRNHPIDA